MLPVGKHHRVLLCVANQCTPHAQSQNSLISAKTFAVDTEPKQNQKQNQHQPLIPSI